MRLSVQDQKMWTTMIARMTSEIIRTKEEKSQKIKTKKKKQGG